MQSCMLRKNGTQCASPFPLLGISDPIRLHIQLVKAARVDVGNVGVKRRGNEVGAPTQDDIREKSNGGGGENT